MVLLKLILLSYFTLNLLSQKDVLLMLVHQASLPFIGLSLQVPRHLRLLLLLELWVQIKIDLKFAEAWQICLLLFELLASKILLSSRKIVICHFYHCLGFRDGRLIVTGHLIIITMHRSHILLVMIIIVVILRDAEPLPFTLCWLLGQLTLQVIL